MKKTFVSITFILTLVILTLSGCIAPKDITKDFISEGDFVYYYRSEDEGYAVVDVTEQGSQKESLAIPPYFNDTIVNRMGYIKHTAWGGAKSYLIKERNISANTIFIPYTIKPHGPFPKLEGDKKLFFPCNNLRSVEDALRVGRWCNIYITILGYEAVDQLKLEETAYNSYREHLYIANTAYLFNYEEAPNEGYFFINDFERGGQIENTPYEPFREGYTFGGWYKEPECQNAWNFDQDTLPEAEYDEDNNLIFVETRLYAKWYQN